MDLARGPTFPPSPHHTIPYVEKCRNGARRPSWRENRITFSFTVPRPDEEEESSLTGEGEERGAYTSARARAEIQLRSIDRLRSRQISVRREIRRLVSLASWSRGLLASDTFDSSNRFVTGRNPDLDDGAARANPPHPGEGAEISKRLGRDSARVVEVEVWIDRSESALIGRDSITIDSTKGRGGGREG